MPCPGDRAGERGGIDGKSERVAIPCSAFHYGNGCSASPPTQRLLTDLDSLDWSPGIKKLQSDWIGRSSGAEVDFFLGTAEQFPAWSAARRQQGLPLRAGEDCLRVYTTRPDTLFGATYMVIAPEHPLARRLTIADRQEQVQAYCQAASFKSDRERTEGDAKKKTGVFTGSYAVNPVTGRPIPVWIADYVLASYGTGAIMAVPAHDERDFEFAKTFQLPITAVVQPPAGDVDGTASVLAGQTCFAGQGTAINSGTYDGLSTVDFKARITADLHSAGTGREAINYKLRDWLFSRQRFWGEPFPILHELDDDGQPTGVVCPLEPDELPLDLPHLEDYKPHGKPEPPLGKAPAEWLYVERDGKRYRRETNTMPQWAGSCWYYLRFIDPRNAAAFCDRQKEQAWMPVDLYVGGAEHAVLHLLYARFWHKALFDRGYVSNPEPFHKLVNQGMILGEVEYTAYQVDGRWVNLADLVVDQQSGQLRAKAGGAEARLVRLHESQVSKQGDGFVVAEAADVRVDSRAHKMSKSRGNVVNPDEIVREYGADSLRLYEMFMGPLEATKPWSMAGVSGVRNFLDRVWRMFVDHRGDVVELAPGVQAVEPTAQQNQMLHRTIAAVTDDLESLSFNTAIARLMEFVNFFTKQEVRPLAVMRDFVKLLSPWHRTWRGTLATPGTLANVGLEPWPEFDEALTRAAEIEVPLQVNGKLRARITVPADLTKEQLEQSAFSDSRIQELTSGKQIVKVIVVPGRLVNVVVR